LSIITVTGFRRRASISDNLNIFNALANVSLNLEEGAAAYLSFEDLIQTVDLISLHVPYSAATRHLLSDAEFAKMKDGVFIVNTARGAGTFTTLAWGMQWVQNSWN
jgi:lactate dehydrogenase-like 2-hydroxyacid dehydrogenase